MKRSIIATTIIIALFTVSACLYFYLVPEPKTIITPILGDKPVGPALAEISRTPALPREVSTPTPTFTPTPSLPPVSQIYPKPAADFIPAQYVAYRITKTNCIGGFVPPNITQISKNNTRGTITASSLILTDLYRMLNDAASVGIDLKVVSGYRSYNDQAFLFNSYVTNEMRLNPGITRAQAESRANYYSARPGCSEHQLGTAVDILSSESNYTFNVSDSMRFVQWILSNSEKYNFRISYPQGNTEYKYEPWHLRWYP
jgi:hypothetical protein